MVSFEEAFEQTGHGVFNYVVLATCGLVLMYTNVESLGIGYVMAAAECDLKLSSTEKGMANAAAFIGIVSTAIFWGYLSDQYGRRAIMLPAIASSCIASFASSFATNFLCLFCLRFFTGCLVSASSATVYAYLVLAWVIMAGTWSFHLAKVKVVPWRVFMWSWCIPGIVAAIILVILPESPRFLFSAYGQDSTIPVLAKIYAWNTKKKKEEFPLLLATRLIAFRSSGMYTWMPIMLNEMLFKIGTPVNMCTIMNEKEETKTAACQRTKIHALLYPVSVIMGMVCAVTYVSIGYIMAKIGFSSNVDMHRLVADSMLPDVVGFKPSPAACGGSAVAH
ncbi:unnamed protein product [Diatraea saccharalis]|uniref:Uncharacterized protein n=1 Tax=Diatraea saccharalis TaxID=40085 RepID=A0A9N9WEF6_9NEOP|nr:unnamed protein product [Diatraea saccharalis]